MRCNFLTVPNNFYKPQPVSNQSSETPSFCGRAQEKLIKKLMASKNPKEWKYTFDEIKGVYEHLGYDVMYKRGSHATVNVNGTQFSLVIPHKSKYVAPWDIQQLKKVIRGEI